MSRSIAEGRIPATLFLVVGPSGAGKDTLLDGARSRFAGNSRYVFARRCITRPGGDGTYEELTEEEFESRLRGGGFMLHWRAHGFGYGIPAEYETHLAANRHVVANVSRGIITEVTNRYPSVVLIEVTASPEVLALRLAKRGRETPADIAQRMAREGARLPPGTNLVTIVNDGKKEAGIERFAGALLHPPHRDLELVQRKLGGGRLGRDDYRRVIEHIIAGRFSDEMVADFVVATATTLTSEETVDLASVRAEFATPLRWECERVVDKHSMGGIPGNRITMIVVPIVAASGLQIPKTSSRAITSPAGTADTMEILARVDLDVDAVRRVVRETNGCIVWNGRLNHSRVDEIMNAVTRPRRVDSLRWSVASILSKKLAAGATHCVIDVPVGPTAKVRSASRANELKELFEEVGHALGLTVVVRLTGGELPVGRGIGPALEARDVLSVLRNDAEAPRDLLEKSLDFASEILAFDPTMTRDEGRERALRRIESGEAFETMARIMDAQGPPPREIGPGLFVAEVQARTAGVVHSVDCFGLAGIARTAGAPRDGGAGLDLLVQPGDRVTPDTPLYRIHAHTETGLSSALHRAAGNHAFLIGEV